MLQRIKNKIVKEIKKRANLHPDLSAYLASQLISKAIITRQPFLASRLGFTEAKCLTQPGGVENKSQIWRDLLWRYSGVFPPTEEQFKQFGNRYLKSLGNVDLLGLLGNQAEKQLVNTCTNVPLTCSLESLEPYIHSAPWSMHLAGLRVLVIHPFAESIRTQYTNCRSKIFINPNVLPEFDLQILKSPQTLANNKNDFASWNEAYKHLVDNVSNRQFDVAIIGCGGYGLPVGSFIKSIGKAAIHLGGATQVLFGVSGKRWRERPAYRALMTSAWHPPLEEERPSGWDQVEGGCYW